MDASPLLLDRVAAATGYRDRDEIELSLVQLLQQYLQGDAVTLFKLVHDGTDIRALHCIAAITGPTGVQIIRGASSTYLLSEHQAWRLCVDTREPQRRRTPRGCETLFPVPGDTQELAGVLQVFSQRSPDARDLHLVAGVLRIVRNHMALIDYGERDTLTGLLNRKTFEAQFEKLRRELGSHPGSAADSGTACWIALVDVDHFKAVNDSHGHVFGDEVLLLVSQIMQRNFRGDDRVYRFGGEEFVILLQHTPEQATGAALERLRSAVERHRFPQVGTVTVSIGWTKILPQDAPADAIGRADSALYHAKDSGRNRVFQHERLVAEGRLSAGAQQPPPEIELF
jgi:diguanylate cyclase (GGDEF)-like protein